MRWSWQGGAPRAAARTVQWNGVPLATLEPSVPELADDLGAIDAARAYTLSRFAYVHGEDGVVSLESPLAHGRVVLHDWRATALVHLLAQPRRIDELCARIAQLSKESASDFVALLLLAGIAGEAREGGGCAADDAPALRTWEFHDLLFHARTRGGRDDRPFGATYRFAGEIEPPPPLPESAADEVVVELHRPDLRRLEETDPTFARVQETRRSIREYGEQPLAAAQLGELLYRVGRVVDVSQDVVNSAQGTVRLISAVRPFGAAGGLYELELHVLAHRCDGIEPGLYRYDAERHCLRRRPAAAADLTALLADAGLAAAIPPQRIQVLLIVSARFARVAWKYASIAYSLVLKDVGVLYDTMYLAATAMDLAPCALGCGNADLFARAAGLDAYGETSVGEFLLGSRGGAES